MENQAALELLTRKIAKFVGVVGKILPDDVTAKLKELSEQETMPMAKMIYECMEKNQLEAAELDRPSCQDTGVIQMFVRVGTRFPYIDDLKAVLKDAVFISTQE